MIVRKLKGHVLDLGLAQVDTINLPRFGVGAVDALGSCASLRMGSQILAEDYRREYRRTSGATEEEHRQVALLRAFSLYNSGSPTAAWTYAARVVAATSSPLVRAVTAIADGREGSPIRVAYRPRVSSSVFVGPPSRSSGSVFVEGSW